MILYVIWTYWTRQFANFGVGYRGYAAAGKKHLASVLVDKIELKNYNIDIIYNLIFMHCSNGDTFKVDLHLFTLLQACWLWYY